MPPANALWPAVLDHFRRETPDPQPLAGWYARLLGARLEPLGGDDWLVAGRTRRLVIGRGGKGGSPWYALAFDTPSRLAAYRESLARAGLALEASPSPLFADGAFALADPDGRRIVFGLPRAGLPTGEDPLPGRLQHYVVATAQPEAMLAWYRDRLGFVESDRVMDGDALAAAFLRSDPEHHSFALFRAPAARPDHHCFETSSWNDLRDWGDRMAGLRIPLWWGPGRHGPGNNLFFMIEDPDGYKVEFSAELEHMPQDMAWRSWAHEQRTLNLWGSAWMRS